MTRRSLCVATATATLALAGAAAGCQREPEAVARAPIPRGGQAQRIHSGPGSAMTITPDTLRAWSEQLCTLPPVDLAGALAALGIAGSLVSQSADFSIVEPPPAGAARLGLTLENLGRNKGKLATVEITPSEAITRAELDQRFGTANFLPRVDYDRPYVLNYRVEVPGAPFRCSVFASFADEPSATSATNKIRLRRDSVQGAAK